MSKRTQTLKKRLDYKGTIAKKYISEGKCKIEASPVPGARPGQKACLERARLVTESYKATAGEPEVIRRAKALAHILGSMTVYIQDGELIVGNIASDPHFYQLYPEITADWLNKAFNDGYKSLLDEKGRAEFKEIAKYWSGKTTSERLQAILPKRLKDFVQWNPIGWAHNFRGEKPGETLDIDKLFALGLNGIIGQINSRLKEIETGSLPADNYIEQRNTLEAMRIALKAANNFSKRYAVKARDLASAEKNAKRKEELQRIAEVCEWVPDNPPRTLHEALQSFYFICLIAKQLETCGQNYGNRLDVLMNPYYQKDKREGSPLSGDGQLY
ncbi:pyruvate formate lyase family protein [Chloroflexota bacterium]